MMKAIFENDGYLSLESFETEDSLKKWCTVNGGSIEISQDCAKMGNSSLKWNYTKGSMLRLSGYEPLKCFNDYPGSQGIKLWIYNTKKIDGDITVRIGKSKLISVGPAYSFKVHMNFEGWRAVWIRVNVSAKAFSTNIHEDIDGLEIEAPKNSDSGVLYFDAFEVMESLSYLQCSDFQVTYLPLWPTGYQYEAYKRIPTDSGDEICSDEHKKTFKLISERLDNYIFPENIDYQALDDDAPIKIRYNNLQELIKEELNTLEEYDIRRMSDGRVTGPGLFSAFDDKKEHYFVDFERIWIALVLDWKFNNNEKSKQKFFDLLDYFNEQGWAEGSACGALAFDEIRADGYVNAIYMMRDELHEVGLFEREWNTLRWRSEFGYVFSYKDEDIAKVVSMTCDKMRSIVLFQLMYILGMEDTPLKVRYMKQYVKYLHDVIAPKQGIENGIKPDYTFWHHFGPYMTAYGAEALGVLGLIRLVLHETCFDISKESVKVLENALDAYRRSSIGVDIPPLRLSGRFPGKKGTMHSIIMAYAAMANCGNRKLTADFLDIWLKKPNELKEYFRGKLPFISWLETPGQLQLFEQVLKYAENNNIERGNVEDGHFVFPYGGYCIYRRKNSVVTINGWSCYIWDYESGIGENLYGRYTNYGSTVLASEEEYFNPLKGLDWSNIPGTTSKYLMHDELINKESDTNRYHSDEAYLGGVSSGRERGIYALKMHDTHFDTTFRAKKSWFCFGDKVICLGSDIANNDINHRTETTLFQCMNEKQSEIILNEKKINVYDYEAKKGDCVWLTDLYGNGYIIPDGKGFKLKRNRQPLKLHAGNDCSGETAVAFIEHGYAPKSADYEYVILPNCNVSELKAEAENPSYSVLRKNEFAHIIKSENAIGYVLFEANTFLDYGVVKTVDTPCIIMETKISENEVSLNIADPDLRMCDFTPQSEEKYKIRITLKGEWGSTEHLPKNIYIEESDNETIIVLECRDGQQTDIRLKMRK